MNIRTVLENEILALVEKPSRYLGNEVNAYEVHDAEVRLALVFPDLYDLGLGNLGVHILYSVLNQLPWMCCERAYSPAVDMEAQLRERGLGTFALESKDTLDVFDGIGFTLQSELTYTNILNMLDLCGIALRTTDRKEDDPITFAGGPSVFNPEPLAPFMDFFVIGDGEDVIIEIAEVFRSVQGRAARLDAFSKLEGVYVPALYPFDTLPDGQILPKLGVPKINKRVVRDFDNAHFPKRYIVPFTEQVHDRIGLEVLRGCTQGCRFCAAGMVTRPVRERSVETVTNLLKESLDSTGYEEVSLVSLSTCDYSQVRKLVEATVSHARPRRVTVSLPSLRLDSFSVDLTAMTAETRKSGVTFAPEAATPRLRSVINKFIPDKELLDMSAAVYGGGWDLVKLYFMVGLPTERDEDVEAIADLCVRTLKQGQSIRGRARLNMGVSSFVPKPFTPFQWSRQITRDETRQKHGILLDNLKRYHAIKIGRHEPEETYLEGLITRGDRRTADLIQRAFEKGCRFDAWGDLRRFDLWEEAIEEIGFDVDFALRERDLDERLPWDHIDVFVDTQWLKDDYRRALKLQWAPDCRAKRCHKCGVIDRERPLCASMLRDHIEGRKAEAEWIRSDTPVPASPEAKARYWIRVGRVGTARFLDHHETNNAWIRALRRADLPLAYSQGFHPHPKITYSSAFRVGEESIGEIMDLRLTEPLHSTQVLKRLQEKLPAGFQATEAHSVSMKQPSLMTQNQGGLYLLYLDDDEAEVGERVQQLVDADELLIMRKGKKRSKAGRFSRGRRVKRRERVMREIDARPMIRSMSWDEDARAIELELVTVEDRPGKPRDIVALLGLNEATVRIRKLETLKREGDLWLPLMDERRGVSCST